LALVIKMGLTKLNQTHFYSMAGGRGVEPRCPFTSKCLIFKNFLSLQEQAENPTTQFSHINKPLRLIRCNEKGDD
jgi:hypothetical protein